MMRRDPFIAAVMLVLTIPVTASAAPTLRDAAVRRTPAGCEIAFTLTEPTDVTVRIVDAKGEVVRHLVSGMVGLERAAAPFAPKTLIQKITWDGKDDAGNPVNAAECKATVGVGIAAKFDKFILWEKDACPASERNHCYTAPNGNTYVNQSSGVHLDTMRLFNGEGRLIRQVWPPSLNRPAAAVEGLLAGKFGATDWDGDGVPIKICHNSWYLVGVNAARGMTLTSDGCLVGVRAKAVQQGFWALDRNDFPIVMNWTPPSYHRRGFLWRVAAGTGGDIYVAYASRHIVMHFRAGDMSPINSFTHNGKEKLAEPRHYLGEIDKAGDDEGHFIGPVGVALGDDGNLHVLEGKFSGYGNFTIEGIRVKVYSREGKFIRFADKAEFPSARPIPDAVIAAENAPRALCFPFFLRIGPGGRLVVMNSARKDPGRVIDTDIEGKDFKGVKFPWAIGPYNGYNAFDAAGNWYVTVATGRNKPQQVWKFSPDGQRAGFGDQDAITLSLEGDPFTLTKGLCVAKNGDIYVVVQPSKWTQKPPDMTGGVRFGDLSARGEAACQTRVDVYGPDGALKKQGIVKSLGINDVALDRDGNIYIIEGTMWHGAQMGQTATGHRAYKKHWPFAYLTPEQAALDPKTQANKRYSLLSRLVKFSPEGGILDDPGGKGQLWHYAGVSGVSPWNCDTECPAAQIHIDPDERIWIPDSFMYCIKAIDKAGNEIIRVGKYGNEDCRGGGGDKRHPELKNVVIDPEIPLSYPKGMAVYRDDLFISDMFAHRVMRCRLEYADRRDIALNP